jgi:hypothetical protein
MRWLTGDTIAGFMNVTGDTIAGFVSVTGVIMLVRLSSQIPIVLCFSRPNNARH